MEMTSRINMSGMWYGKYGVKRGDIIDVPTTLDAKSLVAQGLADYGRVSPDKLGVAYAEDERLKEEVMRETPNPVPEEYRLRPDTPVGSPYRHLHRFAPQNQGWSK